jgi:hypothetical protein
MAWRVMSQVQGPRAIFVHLLAPDGKVVSQWDGFGVPAEGWREGDTFIQRASLVMPRDVVHGDYGLQVGMYDPETMQRLPVVEQGQVVTDRILLTANSQMSVMHTCTCARIPGAATVSRSTYHAFRVT